MGMGGRWSVRTEPEPSSGAPVESTALAAARKEGGVGEGERGRIIYEFSWALRNVTLIFFLHHIKET